MPAQILPVSALHEAPQTGICFRLRDPVAPTPRALVLLNHGVGGNEHNLVPLATQLPDDLLVVLTRGPLQFGPGQYGWFRVGFTAHGPHMDPAEAEAGRAKLLAFISEMQATHGIATEKTIVAGFSQGGIMSASVGLSAPGQVAGFGLLSGRILPELAPHLATKLQLGALQAFISHGTEDNTLPVSWAERAEKWLDELGVRYEAHRYAAGHELTAEMIADFLKWQHKVLD